MYCPECGSSMGEAELRMYERCERCEWDWNDRINAWRHGAPDTELDRHFAREWANRVLH